MFNRFCPICKSKISFNGIVIISPWVRKIIKTKRIFSRLASCNFCNGATFSYRYSEIQTKRLYENYRGKEYQKLRYKYEKWYKVEYNDNHNSSFYVSERKKIIESFLRPYLFRDLNSVVDVGGGNGELIPNLGSTTNLSSYEKYVVDIKNSPAVPGVIKKMSLQEIGKTSLIIYAHIIEHVSNPLFELANLLQYSDQIYVETPNGVPKANFFNKSITINLIFAVFSFFPKIWRNLFSISVGRKQKYNILRQSEHINFFTVDTIKKLADMLNCNYVCRIILIPDPIGEEIEVIQAFIYKK